MRFIHLSDLHFGRGVQGDKLEALGRDLVSQAPALLVITGDVTDRGTLSQFRWARDFLRSLAIPFISVPGNREVAISAIWEWMIPPLAMSRYRSFFGHDDRVIYHHADSNTVFFGLNSVHPFPSWPGTVARESRYWLREQAARFPEASKVLFLHHPVLPVIRGSSFWAHALSDASELLNICTSTGITLILQGHKHRSAVMEVNYPERNSRIVVSSGGAPLMSRWDPVYHTIETSGSSLFVKPREFLQGEFREKAAYHFSFNSDCRE